MDPTDSPLIQSRVLQLQLSCLQIPLSILNTAQQWQSAEDASMSEKKKKKHYAKGKKPTNPGLQRTSLCVEIRFLWLSYYTRRRGGNQKE